MTVGLISVYDLQELQRSLVHEPMMDSEIRRYVDIADAEKLQKNLTFSSELFDSEGNRWIAGGAHEFNCSIAGCHAKATSSFDSKVWTKAIKIVADHMCESSKVRDAALRIFFNVGVNDELPKISKTLSVMSQNDAKTLKEAYSFGSLPLMGIEEFQVLDVFTFKPAKKGKFHNN
jgi:hypothetical protein